MTSLKTIQDIEQICLLNDILIEFIAEAPGHIFVSISKFKKFDLFDIRLRATLKKILHNFGIIGVEYVFVRTVYPKVK